ncbi:MAG: cytochrome c maturation protein CcmE [Actinobacteria bacterium]|nr:cytochrome c maturation protein CcmE [Actinomycetota bacterium]
MVWNIRCGGRLRRLDHPAFPAGRSAGSGGGPAVDVNESLTDDPESSDAAEIAPSSLDLTPRTGQHTAASGHRSLRAVFAIGAVVVVVLALVAVLFTGLRDASTFFYNVDEAADRREDLAGERFRMQGNVVPDSVVTTESGVSFVISYGGAEVPVDHVGDPPELFGPKIPVVLEGTFVGNRFASDEILIRHDNAYDEANPERIQEAERDAQQGVAG